MTVTVLNRAEIISEDGFKGEEVSFCNSSPALSDTNIPDLRTAITPQIGSFNSWAEMTYEGPDGLRTHLKKDEKVIIEDRQRRVVTKGSVMSLRDHSVWILKDEGVDIHYPNHETIRRQSDQPQP